MGLLITFLTFILVLDCLLLILLVLIQLPKKEAGAGVAFGAGTTDALFGAGSGNVLTKVTKYCAGVFLGLALLLSVLNINHSNARKNPEGLGKELKKLEQKQPAPAPMPSAATPPPAAAAAVAGAVSNTAAAPEFKINLPTPTNAPAAPKAK